MAEMTKDQLTVAPSGVPLDAAEEARYRERTPTSLANLQRAWDVIPTGHAGGMWYQLPYPVLLERGLGSRVWDVDGNEYLDMRIGDWVMYPGHCNPKIREAIVAQLDKAAQLGCPDEGLAVRHAELLIERMPSVDRVKYVASGTDANLMALRGARAHTGKTKLAKAVGAYHGIADILVVGKSTISFVSGTTPPGITPGVAQDVIEFDFNDADGTEAVLERHADELAAVLIEPVMGAAGMIPATTEFLQRLREATARLGIVLIFDEVVTLPMYYGGAQAHHGVMPDLTTMGKVIGGGIPAAAVGGSAEVMAIYDPLLHGGKAPVAATASTFGGNCTAMAAGIACLEQLTPEVHDRVAALRERAVDGINEVAGRREIPLQASGLGHLFGIHWAAEPVVDGRTKMESDGAKIANIMMTLMNLGVYQYSFGSFLLGMEHDEEDMDRLVGAIDEAIDRLGYVG
jgi:glutamate-1-semialdehyde 2,1-aminomutase